MQPTPATHIVHTVAVYVALAHNVFLYSAVLYKNRKMERELPGSALSSKINIAQLLTLFLFILFNLGSSLVIQPFISFIPCQAGVDASVVTFAISRIGVWLYGLYRIHVAFHSKVISSLGYKKKTLLCTALVFIIWFLFFTISSLSIAKGVMTPYNDTNPSDAEFCAYDVTNPGLSFLNLLLDQIAQCMLFVLFYRKMKAISRISEIGQKADEKIVYVMHKYTVLMGTNFFSTLIMTVAIVFFNPIAALFTSIDSMINMWTVLLFDARYNAQYRRMFVCCLSEKANDQLAKAMAASKNKVPSATSKQSADVLPSTAVTVTVDHKTSDACAPTEVTHGVAASNTIQAKSELNKAVII